MIDLRKILDEDIEKIEKHIRQAAVERDEAATPTESTHDQTRQIANQLYNSLLEERLKLQRLRNVVLKFKKVMVVEKDNGEIFRFMLVPDGLGGRKVEEATLVGENSPLGQKIKDLGVGDKYEINEGVFRIVNVEQ